MLEFDIYMKKIYFKNVPEKFPYAKPKIFTFQAQ